MPFVLCSLLIYMDVKNIFVCSHISLHVSDFYWYEVRFSVYWVTEVQVWKEQCTKLIIFIPYFACLGNYLKCAKRIVSYYGRMIWLNYLTLSPPSQDGFTVTSTASTSLEAFLKVSFWNGARMVTPCVHLLTC